MACPGTKPSFPLCPQSPAVHEKPSALRTVYERSGLPPRPVLCLPTSTANDIPKYVIGTAICIGRVWPFLDPFLLLLFESVDQIIFGVLYACVTLTGRGVGGGDMRFVGLAIIAMFVPDAVAQTPPAQPTSKPEPPELIFELISRRAGASIQLINGSKPVRLSDWDTVVVTPVPDKANPERFCTGTLVGPGVVLLAAHCIDRRSTPGDRSAGLKVDNQTLPLICDAPDEYYAGDPWSEPSPRRSQDFAICVAPGAATQATIARMRFDQVDVRPLRVDAAVLMTGYGCTDIQDAKVRRLTLRIGDSEIRTAADGIGPRGAYAELVSTGTEPALCNGDSGGSLMTGATVAQPFALRRIRGVNSTTEDMGGAVISRVAMLSDPSFSAWAEAFVARYPGAYVCGLSKPSSDMRCRP